MKAAWRRLPVRLISNCQGLYYEVRQFQKIQHSTVEPIDPVRITLIALFCGLFCGCSTVNPAKIDTSDWAIDTYFPSRNEIARAEERAKEFWRKNSARYGNEPHYLAIDTTKLLDGEIVQDLWPKLISSAHATSFFAGSLEESPEVNLYCVMIFDTNTGKFVSNQGYAIVDFPEKGEVVRFGNYVARFIGSGG
jgi:hypothetical protein